MQYRQALSQLFPKASGYFPGIRTTAAAGALFLAACSGTESQSTQPLDQGQPEQTASQSYAQPQRRKLTVQDVQNLGLYSVIPSGYAFAVGTEGDVIGDDQKEYVFAVDNCENRVPCDSKIIVADTNGRTVDSFGLNGIKTENVYTSKILGKEKSDIAVTGYRTGGNHLPQVVVVHTYNESGGGSGTTYQVTGTGDCLNIRKYGSTDAPMAKCVPDGTLLDYDEGTIDAPHERDGYTWTPVKSAELGINGWAADQWLQVYRQSPALGKRVFAFEGHGYAPEVLDVDGNGLNDVIVIKHSLGTEAMVEAHAVSVERYEFQNGVMTQKEVPRDIKLKYAEIVMIDIEYGKLGGWERHETETRKKLEDLLGADVVAEASQKAAQYRDLRTEMDGVVFSSAATDEKARRLETIRSNYGSDLFSYGVRSYGITDVSGITSLIEYVQGGSISQDYLRSQADLTGMAYVPTSTEEWTLFFLQRIAVNLDQQIKQREYDKLVEMGISVSQDGRTVTERDPQSGGNSRMFNSREEADNYITDKLSQQYETDRQTQIANAEETFSEGVQAEKDMYGFSPAEYIDTFFKSLSSDQ